MLGIEFGTHGRKRYTGLRLRLLSSFVSGGHSCPPALSLVVILIRRGCGNREVKGKVKGKVNGSGQECPLYTLLPICAWLGRAGRPSLHP